MRTRRGSCCRAPTSCCARSARRRARRACASTPTPARTTARSRSSASGSARTTSSCSTSSGCSATHTCIAHCIHLTDDEKRLLAARGAHVCHCPSSNLKLASGICPVPELIAAGVAVAIGADGAPCNNNLDGFLELRLAALLHKHRVGPRALPAPEVVRLATLGGAAALGLADRIGSLELGKRGDVIAVDVTAAARGPDRLARGPRSPTRPRRATSATWRSTARSSCATAALLTLDVEQVRVHASESGESAVSARKPKPQWTQRGVRGTSLPRSFLTRLSCGATQLGRETSPRGLQGTSSVLFSRGQQRDERNVEASVRW